MNSKEALLQDGTSLVFFHNGDEPEGINSYSSPPDPSIDVYAQLLDDTGITDGPPFVVNSDNSHTQHHRAMTESGVWAV